MTRFTPLLIAALLVGCDDEYAPLDSSDPSDGCKVEGFQAARNPGLLVTQVTYNGLLVLSGFDPQAEYDGEPAACIREDGRAAYWKFEVDGALWGELFVEADQSGSYALSETTATARISVNGPPPATYVTGEHWQSGTWSIQSVDPLTLDLSGYAVNNGSSLSITLSAEASR